MSSTNIVWGSRTLTKGWQWITNLKTNRQVSETKGTYVAIADLALAEKQVKLVWLKEYGSVLGSAGVSKKLGFYVRLRGVM